METTVVTRGKHHPVAGFVRGLKANRDGNTKFRVVNQWFVIPTTSTYAKLLKEVPRVVVIFEETEKKHPKIVSITPIKTGVELRDIMSRYQE